jgi:hypothetical protein
MDDQAEITPQHLAALSLIRAAAAIEETALDPTMWFFIILDLHRAVYCALVAALASTTHIGAFPDKLKAEWLEYFEESRSNPDVRPPRGDYVLPFVGLLERAENETLHMIGSPLQLRPDQRADIVKLNEFRDDLEHVKPQSWHLMVEGLPRMVANAAKAFEVLLESFAYHLENDELAKLERALLKIKDLENRYPSSTPSSWRS